MSAAMGLFLGTQERVRNSRGKRAISVRATEVLLYRHFINFSITLSITSDLCYRVMHLSMFPVIVSALMHAFIADVLMHAFIADVLMHAFIADVFTLSEIIKTCQFTIPKQLHLQTLNQHC